MSKSPGQLAYEADLLVMPRYYDGGKRKSWRELGRAEQDSWERNPTPYHTANGGGLIAQAEYWETIEKP